MSAAAGELFRAGRGAGSFGEQPKPRVSKCKRKIVKTLSPTLGIAGEKPQHSEDLQRKARPEGGTPKQPPEQTAFWQGLHLWKNTK